MKTISASEINKIREASDKLKGTNEYNKYYMEIDTKCSNTWKFLSHGLPMTGSIDGIIKKVKNRTYLIIDDTRYELRDVHIELLNIRV